MSGEWWQRLDARVRALTPIVLTLLLVFLSTLPWRLPNFATVAPAFSLMAIYYWGIYRPDRLPYVAGFLLGLLQDLLTGTPIGMTALVLLLVQGVVVSQRRFLLNQPFVVVWAAFFLVAPGAALLNWGIGSLMRDAIVPALPLVVQTVLTILLYPVLGGGFSLLQHHFMQRA